MRLVHCMFAALLAVIGANAAVPTRRDSWPSFSPDRVKSFALFGWGPLEKSAHGADLVIVDVDLCPESEIKSLKSQGKLVVCYFSIGMLRTGTLEKWRGDADTFYRSNVQFAKAYKGFGGSEVWLNIQDWQSLKPLMTRRIQKAAEKGCDGIEADDVDCYNNSCVPGASYQQLMKDQADYFKWFAETTHSHSMGIGMKNAVELLPEVGHLADFFVNEQCASYGHPHGAECGLYKPYHNQGKVILGVEYKDYNGRVCDIGRENNILTKYRANGWHNCFGTGDSSGSGGEGASQQYNARKSN